MQIMKLIYLISLIALSVNISRANEVASDFEIKCHKKCTKHELRSLQLSNFRSALIRGEIDRIKYYIENKIFSANEIVFERYIETPLSTSAYYKNNNSLEIVNYLIDNGADVNQTIKGAATTPLLTAIWKKNNEIAKLLLSRGADISIKSDRGYDACIFAHRWSNFEIMPSISGCCEK